MIKKEFRLNSASSQRSVNKDTIDKIEIVSKTNILPIDEIHKVINLGEQFNDERQNSKLYRLTGTFNTLFNNVLINTTGINSWRTFNEPIFKDETNINGGILTYKESVRKHLRENNGWFGYKDPESINKTSCTWVDMEPNRELFTMTPKNLIKNWEVTITYPALYYNQTGNFTHPIVNGGLLLINVSVSKIGDRQMLTFETPVKHGLKRGDAVKLSGLIDVGGSNLSPHNGEFNVSRVGEDNGDKLEYCFSVDIDELVNINNSSRMRKIVNGRESAYYIRMFKKINTTGGKLIEDDDYEIYPLAFGQTIYEDKMNQFVFNEDIDVSGLRDNLGRPLSEIFITVIKTDSNNVFTETKSGIKLPYINNIENNLGLSDINRITNNITTSHIPLESNVKVDNEWFFGDVVEYNVFDFQETVLGDVYHRFNTINRETGGSINGAITEGVTTDLGVRLEGYVYKPHHKIKIREFSNYIEEGTYNTLNKPNYAINIGDGRYIWRDMMDIGINDSKEEYLDYPFLNGRHYINSSITLPLFRQDPFNLYKLKWTNYPPEASGIEMEDKVIIKNSEDVC